MAKLSDFIEALHNDISFARASSDLETVELAKVYANNELLRSLDISVPRMKIKDLEIEVNGFVKMNDSSINKSFKTISNERIINQANVRMKTSLSKLINDDTALNKALDKATEETIAYSKRYLKKEMMMTKRVGKIAEIFIKNFDKQVIGYSKKVKKEVDKTYEMLDASIVSDLSESIAASRNSLDFEFNKEMSTDHHQEVKFRFTIVEDDLIWEMDKNITNGQ